MLMRGYEPCYAVIRYDTWYTDYGVQHDMTIKAIVWDKEFADSEAKRLNSLPDGDTKGTRRYMVHPTRAQIRDEKAIQK